jgi:hypothetical protein
VGSVRSVAVPVGVGQASWRSDGRLGHLEWEDCCGSEKRAGGTYIGIEVLRYVPWQPAPWRSPSGPTLQDRETFLLGQKLGGWASTSDLPRSKILQQQAV